MREGERDRVFLLTWLNPNHVKIKILIFFGPLLFSITFRPLLPFSCSLSVSIPL